MNALVCSYEAVVATLELLTEDNDKNKALEFRGILLQITSLSFIVSLVAFDRILSCTNSISDILQAPELDLAKAADVFVTGTIVTLDDFESWNNTFEYIIQVASHPKQFLLKPGKGEFLKGCLMTLLLQILLATSNHIKEHLSTFQYWMPSFLNSSTAFHHF